MTTNEILMAAVSAKRDMAIASSEQKNKALEAMADCLEADMGTILMANREDLTAAKNTISEVMLDRLTLNEKRIRAMADGVREVAALPDPCGVVLEERIRPNGLVLRKCSVPMGVIAIIYESRPNVTSDAAALALKAGSACILRAGKEAHRTAGVIVNALRNGLHEAGLPGSALGLIEDVSRASAEELMCARGYVDLLIPRGGKGLIRACVEQAKVPVLETGTGICHIYIDRSADQEKALSILENAKCSRPSVCNAAEVCLVDEAIAGEFLPKFHRRMVEERLQRGVPPVELRLDRTAAEIIPGTPAGDDDFDTEFLDYIMAVGVVKNVQAAVAHIVCHSTGHSESIVAENAEAQNIFTAGVDSAAVYVNASTRFTDGGEFGLGCEMGISTQKLHARGPLGLKELCSYKYIIRGNGQIR